MKFTYLLYLLWPIVVCTGYGQHQISGYVYDQQTEKPLQNVNISIVGESTGGTTNEKGYFQVELMRLPALLYFSHIGYAIDQIMITEQSLRKVEVFLVPEVTNLDEVLVSASRIQKVDLGDTLNVIDYSIVNNKMILVASPFRKQLDQRLYLTDLSGNQLANRRMRRMGKQLKIPEHMSQEYLFLFEDFLGFHHILTHENLKQIDLSGDSISFSYETSYPEFLSYLLPNKVKLDQSLFYQQAAQTVNITSRTAPDAYRPQVIKTITDERGKSKGPYDPSRYIEAPPRYFYKHMIKNVSAPIVAVNNEVLIFDFFQNHFEAFDAVGRSIRKVPIDFHLEAYTFFFNLLSATDLNQQEFKQEIIMDKATNKIYAVFQPLGKRAILKEIDPITGKIIQEIEIPDLPNIDKIKVHDSTVYFTYQVKGYPFYTNLYRMKL